MGLFDSLKSFTFSDDQLNQEDLINLRNEYQNALDICDYIIKWSKYYQDGKSEKFVTGDDDYIMYHDPVGADSEYFGNFPDDIESEYRKLFSTFDPTDAESISEANRCFNEHKIFAENTKMAINDFLEKLDKLEEKMERVEYMRETNEDFEHNGFDVPSSSIKDRLSDNVEERIQEYNKVSKENDATDKESIDRMKISQMVYFIAEELRKEQNKEYDVELYNNIYSAYPKQSEIICENIVSTNSKKRVKENLQKFGENEILPPLNNKQIEFYIMPRAFESIPPKTPEEIEML
jgi:hypothetical protein